MTRTYQCSDPADRTAGIAAAIDAVRRGDLIVMPTDTVYGIGADAFTPTAVDSLLTAKQRGRDMPVPVLVGNRRTLDGLVMAVPPAVHDLVDAFWPGPLTIVVEQAPTLAWDLGDADGTVAVRMPLHPVALEVLEATGPMAVSSANVSGQPPATTAEAARDQLGWFVEVYLEAGSCGEPVASTIVDVTGEVPRVLRQGALDLATLRGVVPNALDRDGNGPDDEPSAEDAVSTGSTAGDA
ncbi:L-threonylcarbamoyladenylate synthase [Cryptosporangium minutisporangium]|uniref:L-threonylcarbamoyladenylate synthase n=1 Tax=Cryptosporangium minutisporangium TaxID=113569 RepID=A0ABP6T1H3_9ACTN